jgi:hypothetical protein
MELLTPVRLFYVAGMIASYFLFSVSRPLQELSGQPIFRGFRLAGLTRSRSVPRHHYGPVPEGTVHYDRVPGTVRTGAVTSRSTTL